MSHEQLPHRKRVKHYNEPGHVHELTFSCYNRLPLLTNDHWRALLVESIDRANQRHHYRMCAFVFMPEHVHVMVYPEGEPSGIDQLLRAIKRPFSLRIKQLLQETDSPLLNRLTVNQRPGVTTFRFWQEGPGYDRNLTEVPTTLTAIDYIHLNPVRRGLVERATDWRWSSAAWYEDPQECNDADLPTVTALPGDWLNQPSR